MIAMIVGTALALAALAYVLYPLLRGTPEREPGARPAPVASGGAVTALRDVEFDYATGKLSETDYASLRSTYVRRAAHELRGESVATECPACGAVADEGAVYCSSCGARLAL